MSAGKSMNDRDFEDRESTMAYMSHSIEIRGSSLLKKEKRKKKKEKRKKKKRNVDSIEATLIYLTWQEFELGVRFPFLC
jgi:hypothetical protein